ncbi:hypothetical protein V8B97DRAFT_1953941 [Scleroderma yunnanense]
MSDQSPPPAKPKPGSLRDRIAAFENKGTTPCPTPGAPVPRPKPGNIQWKPRPPSPSTASDQPSKIIGGGSTGTSGAGMSASDAKESISRGGTLKERMAALQGKGAFGGTAPAPPVSPKPASVEKPKWKPPPRVASPPALDDDGAAGHAASRSPPPRRTTSPSFDVLNKANEGEADAAPTEGDHGTTDHEEEERQRRATLAARMARLGGARIGMPPPAIAPKPSMRKSSTPIPAPEPAQETKAEEQSSQAVDEPPRRDSLGSASIRNEITADPELSVDPKDSDQASITSTSSARVPASMPVPVGPRRAAPPRRKTYKSTPSVSLLEPSVPVPIPVQPDSDTARTTLSWSSSESLVTGDVHPEIAIASKSVDASDDMHVSPKQQDDVDQGATLVEQPKAIVDEPEDEEEMGQLHKEGDASIKGSSTYATAEDEHHGAVLDPEPEQTEQASQPEPEDGPEEESAFNPPAGLLSVARRASVEAPANVDTEEVGDTILSTVPVSPTVDAEQGREEQARSIPGFDVEETRVEVEVEEQKEDEDQAVKPAPVKCDDEHETELDGAHELALVTGAEITRRVLYHNTGVDDEEELDADAGQDNPPQFSHQENKLYPAGQTSVYGRTGDTDESDILTMQGEPEVEEKVEMYADTSAGAAVGVVDNTNITASAEQDDDDGIVLPHPSRSIPPPPVAFGSKATVPSHSSPPVRTVVQTLKDDEEERAASPDIPPRPIPPPPMRSIPDVARDLPGPPQFSIPPPPRRTSLRVAKPPADAPPTPMPPPVTTSPPRPIRRPTSPPIITALPILQEPRQVEGSDEDPEASAIDGQQESMQESEDGESVRRKTIADRMARLGGIHFGVPTSMHHLARPPMPPVPPPTSIPPDDAEAEATHKSDEDDEAARKERIAAKLAGMGGMRFGMLPPSMPVGMAPSSARRLVSKQEDSESEDVALPVPAPASQRGPPSRKLPPPAEPKLEQNDLAGSRFLSDDSVEVEAEESEIEEVHYSDADVRSEEDEELAPPLPPPRCPVATSRPLDALPTPPPRSLPGRPPVPSLPKALLTRRASATTGSVQSSRTSSLDYSSTTETPVVSSHARTLQEGFSYDSGLRPQSEYVMVEVDPVLEEVPASPPRRPTRVLPPSIPLPPPPPPSAIDPPEDLASSAQWELPSIPQAAEFIADSDLASSGWSDDSTAVHVPPPLPPPQAPALSTLPSIASAQVAPGPSRRSTSSIDQVQALSADDLMTAWGKVGAQVAQAASDLFEKSKRTLVGDGSYAGFVRAALAQVPGALRSSDPEEWGYMVYAQTGTKVQRRVVDIMPGDVISFRDAKLKGHKGLHGYHQTVGTGESGPVVAIVNECEAKKMKVRVWQANQHVGRQTVENVSYKLEDLKSGQVKIFRILEKAL